VKYVLLPIMTDFENISIPFVDRIRYTPFWMVLYDILLEDMVVRCENCNRVCTLLTTLKTFVTQLLKKLQLGMVVLIFDDSMFMGVMSISDLMLPLLKKLRYAILTWL